MRRGRPRVENSLHRYLKPDLRWEGDARLPEGESKVAVLAQYSRSSVVSKSLDVFVRELTRHGYYVVMSSACTDPAPLQWRGERPERLAILRKPNVGYDFGSWAVAMAEEPRILDAEKLLVVNDSLVGPFWSLDEIIGDFETTYGDWWGLTRTYQAIRHLQSFFLGFNRSVIASPTFTDFWSGVRLEPTKLDIIHRYEIGLSKLMYDEGFAATAHVDGILATRFGLNPTMSGWSKLLELGVPFIKRELIMNPHLIEGGELAPKVLRDEFNIDIAEWL